METRRPREGVERECKGERHGITALLCRYQTMGPLGSYSIFFFSKKMGKTTKIKVDKDADLHLTALRPYIRECVEYMGQLIGRDILWLIVSTVYCPCEK